jgi:uncharacterized protein HemY
MNWVMRTSLWGLIIGLALVLLVRSDPGYVLFVFQGWSVETTFWVFWAVVFAAYFAFVWLWRLIKHSILIPWHIGRWRSDRHARLSQETLESGFEYKLSGDARAAIKELKAAYKRRQAPWLKLAIVEAELELGKVKDARSQLQQVPPTDSALSNQANLLGATLAYQEGDYQAAIDKLNQLSEPHSLSSSAQRIRLSALTMQGDQTQILVLLSDIAGKNVIPESERQARVNTAVSRQLAQLKNASEIFATLEALPKQLKSESMVESAAFSSLLLSDQPAKAVEYYKRKYKGEWPWSAIQALDTAPDSAISAISVKEVGAMLGEKAETSVGLALQGRVLVSEKLSGKAKQVLERSYKLNPAPRTALSLGKVCHAMGEHDAAIEWFNKA